MTRGSLGDVVFNNPKALVREELEKLEEIDQLTSTHKTRTQSKASTQDVSVMDDLTETFKKQMNHLQDAENSAKEITTEKELTERLSEVYMLDEDVGTEDDKSETREQVSFNSTVGIARENTKSHNRTSERIVTKSQDTSDQSERKFGSQNDSKVVDTLENKTERLMQLLDKRDALQAELAVKKEKAKTSKDKVANVSTNEIGKAKEISEVGTHKIKSDHFLQSIKRVENQNELDIDSDDEISEQNESSGTSIPMIMPSCIQGVKESNTILDSTSKSGASVTLHKHSAVKKPVSPFDLIRQILYEWKTEATVEYFKDTRKKSSGTSFEEKYKALGKAVDALQIEDDLNDDSDDEVEVRPLSSVSVER